MGEAQLWVAHSGRTLLQYQPAASISALLRSFGREVSFEPGEVLRHKGHHYNDMFLINDGSVDVDLEAGGTALAVGGTGAPIGEIGFLRGVAATATVTARTPIRARLIDDATLARIESEEPALASEFLRYLAETAEERISHNLTMVSPSASYSGGHSVEVYLCRNRELLENAQRLRYEVYCGELGRRSPFADDQRKVIADPLDDFGYTFIAVDGEETIGTIRGNFSFEGPLGVLEELYGMRTSPRHPAATGVCTKFIVKKTRRGGPTAIKLISALVRFGVERGIKECYIDCIPALIPYYRALGFTVVGPKFFHRENGPSYPMRLDLERHGERLGREGGPRQYFKLFVHAEAIKMMDRFRRYGRRMTRGARGSRP